MANIGIQVQGTYSQSLKNITVRDCEVFGAQLGINFNSNVSNSRALDNYVHNTLADGIGVYGVSAPCSNIVIRGNTVLSTGDDAISNNTYSACGSANTNVIITANIVANSGSRGISTTGSTGCVIDGNSVSNSFLSGINAEANASFYPVSSVTITNNQIAGAGRDPPRTGSRQVRRHPGNHRPKHCRE